jgi:excisionase family DNA binding protein
MKENNKFCVSVAELEELLSISRTTAFSLVKTEGFPSFTVGRRILIPVASLERWLDAQAASQKTLKPIRR